MNAVSKSGGQDAISMRSKLLAQFSGHLPSSLDALAAASYQVWRAGSLRRLWVVFLALCAGVGTAWAQAHALRHFGKAYQAAGIYTGCATLLGLLMCCTGFG